MKRSSTHTSSPGEITPGGRQGETKDQGIVAGPAETGSRRARVGRPLRYGETPSKSKERTQAFRAQLREDNVVRLETHVPLAVRREVADIARIEGVSMADVAQALLQYGLQQYRNGASAIGMVSELREALLTTRSGLVELRADLCRNAVGHGNNAQQRTPSPAPVDAYSAAGQANPMPSAQSQGWVSHTACLPAVATEASDRALTQSSGTGKSPIAVFFRRRRQANIRPKGPQGTPSAAR